MTLNNKQIDSKFDPGDQLKLLECKCKNISTRLYKTNALYLENVREILPIAVKASLFSIITDFPRNNSSFFSEKSRKLFQFKIDNLVSKNISLITIEHLNHLARIIDYENKQKIINNRKDIFNSLKNKQDFGNNSTTTSTISSSVDLSSIPPLDDLSIMDSWNGNVDSSYTIDNEQLIMKGSLSKFDSLDDKSLNDIQRSTEVEEKFDSYNLEKNEIDILQSIFVLSDNSTDPYELEDVNHASDSSISLKSNNDSNRLLPETPIGLFEWMLSIDAALIRRLRDLSHDINVELLRSGLVNTLIPLSLLDSVLSGQISTHKLISNILTFKLPINSSYLEDAIDVNCLLITPSDLEFDNAKLRKCRMHLKDQRNLLLRMIKQQRYWEERSIADELRQDWWKGSENK